MKRWELSDEVRGDPAVADRVTQLQPLVEETLGRSGQSVEAFWSTRSTPGGRRSLVLRLADYTFPQGVAREFAENELVASTETRWKINRLWGDLLQARNHQQLAELLRAE
jgi:hypothetical protein